VKTEKTGRYQNNRKKPQQGGLATNRRTGGQGQMKILRPGCRLVKLVLSSLWGGNKMFSVVGWSRRQVASCGHGGSGGPGEEA